MRKETASLRSATGPNGCYNAFRKCAGQFWYLHPTRRYCHVRLALAEELEKSAGTNGCNSIIQSALRHRLEILRLVHTDVLHVRCVVPFTLLALRRDDDCFAFIKHWMKRLRYGVDHAPIHGASRKGEWIYGVASRYDDVLEDVTWRVEHVELSFLMALAIGKMRIVAEFDMRIHSLREFAKTMLGRRLGGLIYRVAILCVGNQEERGVIQIQKKHLAQYLNAIMIKNPSLLPALLNPDPMMGQPKPKYIVSGKPSEAWGVLRSCGSLFMDIYGARQRLEAMFMSKKPLYSYVVDT